MDEARRQRLFEKVAESLVPNARAPQQVTYQKGPTTFDFTKTPTAGVPAASVAKPKPLPKPAGVPAARDEVDDMLGSPPTKINIR